MSDKFNVSRSDCYEELKNNGLIKPNYTSFGHKSSGCMPGLTLFGTTKTGLPKKIYVKKYSSTFGSFFDHLFNDLNDFAVFTVLKKCASKAPKVKLKFANHPYIFSTDIAQKKSKLPEKNYWYFNLADLPYKISNGNLIPINNKKLPIDETISIDKIALIRMAILSLILNLNDLHDENIGFVISENNHKVKAKLACIDFLVDKDYSSLNQTTNIKGKLINSMEMFFCDGSNLSHSFNDTDYIEAFQKIDKNFLTACAEAKDKIKVMSFESDDRKKYTYELIDQWQTNFQNMKASMKMFNSDQDPAITDKNPDNASRPALGR